MSKFDGLDNLLNRFEAWTLCFIPNTQSRYFANSPNALTSTT